VSTLWTPSGEHPVPRAGDVGSPSSPAGRPPAGGAGDSEQAQAEVDALREQLLSAPAELVISNHAMGLWELAALHLSQRPAQLPQAQLAIDALSALVEGMHGRLGEAEATLVDLVAQIRMAFVQTANAQRARQGTSGAASPS